MGARLAQTSWPCPTRHACDAARADAERLAAAIRCQVSFGSIQWKDEVMRAALAAHDALTAETE
jgi:hypothetical protein